MNALKDERSYIDRRTEYDSVRRNAARSRGAEVARVREAASRETLERRRARQNNVRRLEEPLSQRQEQRPAVKKRSGVFSTIAVTLAIFAILAFVVYRYQQVYSSERALNSMRAQIETLETENDKLKTRIAIAEDIESVRVRASEELSMSFPEDEQVIKLSLIDRPVDMESITADETQTEDEGITLKAVINSLLGR